MCNTCFVQNTELIPESKKRTNVETKSRRLVRSISKSDMMFEDQRWKHSYMGVSKNRGTPKSSILIGCSIINHPFWGYHYFWKHPYSYSGGKHLLVQHDTGPERTVQDVQACSREAEGGNQLYIIAPIEESSWFQ